MKILAALLILFSLASSSRAAEPRSEQMLVCGALVGVRYVQEVKSLGKSDKFMHCSISCVMTLYCGPAEATLTGALKEVYDAMGFGDPEMADFEADLKGVKAGTRIGLFGERSECYRACSALFP